MKNEQVVHLPLNRLTGFPEHPFKVRDLLLFAGVFVDTVLDMTRESIIDFILSDVR